MEYFDLLDEKGNKTGKTASSDEAHEKGLLHRSAHVWIANSRKEILLQKRSKGKRAYPGYWDISAAGHISAGQTSLEAAQRETAEELGIDLPLSEFSYLFTTEEHIVLNDGTYVNNEFQDIYLVQSNIDISQMKFTDGEVEEVRFITAEEFKKWVSDKKADLVPHDEEYARIIKTIENL